MYTLFDQPPAAGSGPSPSSVFAGTLPRRASSDGGIGAGIGECWNDSGARLHDVGCTYTVRAIVDVGAPDADADAAAAAAVAGLTTPYECTDVVECELGPSGGRVSSAAPRHDGDDVASMLRLDSEDDEAHRLLPPWWCWWRTEWCWCWWCCVVVGVWV